jgi:hypothetical protein
VNNPLTAPACDHVEEALFPAETLGKDYVVATPTGPNGAPVGHVVRSYGNVDGTQLTYAPAVSTCPGAVNAGQVLDCGQVTQDFEVTGTNEFAVASFTLGGSAVDPGHMPPSQRGDPALSQISAVEQFRTSYVFLAPADYDVSYADVVAPIGAMLVLDGAPLMTPLTPIGGPSASRGSALRPVRTTARTSSRRPSPSGSRSWVTRRTRATSIQAAST